MAQLSRAASDFLAFDRLKPKKPLLPPLRISSRAAARGGSVGVRVASNMALAIKFNMACLLVWENFRLVPCMPKTN